MVQAQKRIEYSSQRCPKTKPWATDCFRKVQGVTERPVTVTDLDLSDTDPTAEGGGV